MRFDKLDLNLLVALDVLLEEQNVSSAAKRLYISQSAMSGSLARLRDYFGDELVTQVGRTLVLTPRAETLVKPVHEILLQIRATVHAVPEFDPQSAKRSFTLMASDYSMSFALGEALRRIEHAAPGIKVEVVSVDNALSPADALDKGEIDFLVVPERYVASDHPSVGLFSDEFVCIVWDHNRTVRDTLSLRQFLQLGHISVLSGRTRCPAFHEQAMIEQGIERTIDVQVPYYNLIPQLIVGTQRIATVPGRLARSYGQYLPIRVLPAPVSIPPLVEVLQWHRYRDSDTGYAWIRDVFESSAQTLSRLNRRWPAPRMASVCQSSAHASYLTPLSSPAVNAD